MCGVKLIVVLMLTNLSLVENFKEDQAHWKSLGEEELQRALNKKITEGVAKNVILFIGDGMGPTTVTSSRIYGKGESGHLTWEKFNNIGVIKTYSANKLVPDSCSTATALFCGVKANHKTAGVDATVEVDDCEASLVPEARLDSLITWAQQAGKSTGFVTTTRVTHATPSALYAHIPNRNWECESKIPAASSSCKDIARQLIEDSPGKEINVIMGGGRQCLQSQVNGSDADPIDTWSCYSEDGRDLIEDWKADKANRSVSHQFISDNLELENVDLDADFTLGIFANGHLKLDYERDTGPNGMPSLTNMTEKTIRLLQKNSNGFFLMVEGGMIDFSHHRGHARQALDETVAFSDCIERALEITDPSETLIVVTSDHSHSMVFSGYPDRGSSVLSTIESAMDQVPYTSLLYGTGGPNNYQFVVENGTVVRPDPTIEDTEDFTYSQQAVVLTDEVTHSGTDVLVYANGPMAHLFNSVHEQTYVTYVICYAAKIGLYQNNSSTVALCFYIMLAQFMALLLYR
ncbi:alkaline phosphatase [Anoplophora glabripennis]|uniref:alkaline phosphatase n=1 Tax=Anoplophora glabripennis TaxID=217634 RepID=UPI000873C3E8|nr:alkaline phosphatase [Anoplophora glabripennis]